MISLCFGSFLFVSVSVYLVSVVLLPSSRPASVSVGCIEQSANQRENQLVMIECDGNCKLSMLGLVRCHPSPRLVVSWALWWIYQRLHDVVDKYVNEFCLIS